jgi:hypothetical protein
MVNPETMTTNHKRQDRKIKNYTTCTKISYADPNEKPEMKQDVREGKAVPASYKIPAMLLI